MRTGHLGGNFGKGQVAGEPHGIGDALGEAAPRRGENRGEHLLVEEAAQRLSEFEAKWDDRHPPIAQIWRRNWARVIPFFDYPPEIRKVIYTTNAIESINMSLRKIIKNRSSFPTDEAASKLLYLALNNISRKWTMPIHDWKAALNRFTIQFEDRMPPL